MLAFRVSPTNTTVDAYDVARSVSVRYRAATIIVCTPLFVTARLVEGYATDVALERSPWVVANLTVPEMPQGAGFAPAWDNVFYSSKSLGYVNAAHQSLTPPRGPVVLTWYAALCDTKRADVLMYSHADWCCVVLADMQRVHPGSALIYAFGDTAW